MPATANIGQLVRLLTHQSNLWKIGVGLEEPIHIDLAETFGQHDVISFR